MPPIRFQDFHGHGRNYVNGGAKVSPNSYPAIGITIYWFIIHHPVEPLILTKVADVSRLAHHNSLRDLPIKCIYVKASVGADSTLEL